MITTYKCSSDLLDPAAHALLRHLEPPPGTRSSFRREAQNSATNLAPKAFHSIRKGASPSLAGIWTCINQNS
jgi:hypothetical protein